jgi:hypothetical protein
MLKHLRPIAKKPDMTLPYVDTKAQQVMKLVRVLTEPATTPYGNNVCIILQSGKVLHIDKV